MKNSGFKTKYSILKKSRKSLRKFREVKGEEDVLQVQEADKQFSLQIRKRDGQCVNCGSTLFLGCSHYFGRGIYATRFDPLNCITLCQACHQVWEYEKTEIYRNYMFMWLGEKEFNLLKARAKLRISPYDAIIHFMKISSQLETNDIEY